jgi:hypothetical protein
MRHRCVALPAPTPERAPSKHINPEPHVHRAVSAAALAPPLIHKVACLAAAGVVPMVVHKNSVGGLQACWRGLCWHRVVRTPVFVHMLQVLQMRQVLHTLLHRHQLRAVRGCTSSADFRPRCRTDATTSGAGAGIQADSSGAIHRRRRTSKKG